VFLFLLNTRANPIENVQTRTYMGDELMKILMMSDLYPPVIGGGEIHVQALSRALRKRGHEVAVCTIGNSRPTVSHCTTEEGIRVYRMEGVFQKMPFLFKDPTRRWHPPIPDPLLTREINKIIRKEKPNVLHAHGWILCSYLPLERKFAIPLILTLHSYGFICPKKNLMRGNTICKEPFTEGCVACGSQSYGFIKSFFAYRGVKSTRDKLALVNKFIAVSSFVKEVYSKHLDIDDKRIIVIPNFYDSGQKDIDDVDLVESANLPEDFILFVGALTPFKGVDTLIKAYDKMGDKTKLVLIGTQHPGYNYTKRRGVTVIENASRRTVLRAYSKCRLVVIPSIWPEPFGLVALEAMSYSKPIVASRVGGLQEVVVDGVTGILVPPSNPRKLAEAITKILQDTDMCQKMGGLGYKRLITLFSVDQVVSKVENIYESAIA